MTNKDIVIDNLDHIIAEWQICQFCKVVDQDRKRSTYGHPCGTCGKASEGGMMFFDSSVHLMVDLIKEAFSTEHKVENKGTIIEYQLNTHYISVLIFFCSLREILLNGLITDLCLAHKIPENIYLRLISDNKLHVQKQDKLFKSLTGEKWTKSLETLTQDAKNNYTELNQKIIELVSIRNAFAHKGVAWNINEGTATDCILCIEPLINLYVSLNNKYVHKKYI